jgi:hypothetical protein
MFLTICYGIICLLLESVRLDYNILVTTVFLDIVFMVISSLNSRKGK